MKRFTALLLALVMMFALCACTGNNGGTVAGEANAEPLTKDDVIKVMVSSHPSWPFDKEWKAIDYMEEISGATLDLVGVPNSEYATKMTLMFADPKSLPDVFYMYSRESTASYANQGALIPYSQVEQYMPNAKAYFESLDENQFYQKFTNWVNYDGELYFFNCAGRDRTSGLFAWMYRKDIFDKHNLKTPETFDEIYEVSKELKKLYPDSYPYGIRALWEHGFRSSGPSWRKYFERLAYYDFDDEKWYFGGVQDESKQLLEFYKKMIDEELVVPNVVTIPSPEWEGLVTSDRAFFFPHYFTRVDFFNGLARPNNPEFNMAVMKPPVATENGVAKVAKNNPESTGFVLPNTGDEKRIANAAKFLDTLYTDEAEELLGWGKEGETYEVVDGKKQYIRENPSDQPNSLYGLGANGMFLRMAPDAYEDVMSEDMKASVEEVISYTMPNLIDANSLNFSPEELPRYVELYVEAERYNAEAFSKFVLGQEPLSKWDEYLENMYDLGVDEIITMFTGVTDRMLG